MEKQRDWANLPEGITASIGNAILAHDLLNSYLSLRGVCRRWREATESPIATNGRFCRHHWILIHPVTALPEFDRAIVASLRRSQTQTIYRLLNFSTGEHVSVDIPQLKDHYIRGCVDGLLLVSKVGASGPNAPTRLLNPFTGVTMDYPALSQMFCMHSMLRRWSPALLSIGFASPTASNLMMVTRKKVAHAVPRSKQWNHVYYPNNAINLAHGFFQGCTYVFSVTRTRKCNKVCLTQFKVKEAHPDQLELGMEHLVIAERDLAKHMGRDLVALVESDGELLLLNRIQTPLSDLFRVFKVVFEEGVHGNAKANLVPLNNIGKHALFINKAYGSISLSTDVHPSVEPNSIYCYQTSSRTIYHPGGTHRKFVDPSIAPPGFCYWQVEKSITRKSIFAVPGFGSRLGKRPRTGT